MHNLRFLDLRRNKFTRVLERDLHTMDNLAKHERSVAVDFSGNSFECSCKLNPFIKWMKKTKVFIRNKASLQCYQGNSSLVLIDRIFFFQSGNRNSHSLPFIR